jgi:type IV pilus assembly protein PilA
MKKISKSKKGFTLVEMVLVIAIIVILAAVILMSVANIIEDAQTGASKVSEHNVQTSSIVGVIEQYI